MENSYPKSYYSKKNLWKWILLYVAIVAIAYGLIYYFFFYKNGGYNYNSQNYRNNFQTQNNSEIANWQKYINYKYGFEFKYPKEVVVKEEGNIIKINYVQHNEYGDYNGEWRIDAYKNDSQDLRSWVNLLMSEFNDKNNKDCKMLPADYYGKYVDIKDAYTLLVVATSDFGETCQDAGYYTLSPNKLTVLKFDLVGQHPAYSEKMLSTFKFTDSQSQNANWKTYTNTEYSFEIKYPFGGTSLQVKEDELGNKVESPNQCTQISYESSFVYISLPPHNVICGGTTGLGIDSIKLKEQINIGGETYQAEGWKLGPNYEFLSFKTDNGLHISYGIVEGLSNSDYKTSKDLNYKILSTFKFTQ